MSTCMYRWVVVWNACVPGTVFHSAFDSHPLLSFCRHLLAAGLDNGRISLYTWKPTVDKSSGFRLVAELDQR